jgi:hypothetical protein
VEFWTPADGCSLDLNLLDFSIWLSLQAKFPAMPDANLATLHLSIAAK